MPLLSLPLEILYEIADTLPSGALLNLLLCSHTLTRLLLPIHTRLLATHDKDRIPALCRALITGTLHPTLLRRLLARPTLTINTRYPGLATWRFPHLPTRDPTRRRHWWWTPGATALYMAVQLRDERLVRLLLAHGADPTIKAGGRRKNSPLYEAVVPRGVGVRGVGLVLARLLVEAGADAADWVDRRRGRRPLLHVAVARGDVSMVRLLLEYGADVGAREVVGGRERGVWELRIKSGVMRRVVRDALEDRGLSEVGDCGGSEDKDVCEL